ncbi:hypothetical protein LINPERHAP1_LOCUS24248 [Linum perenne]
MLVASRDRWEIPRRCVFSSARRTVVVTVFWRAGVRFLNLLERCRDGKSFFVAIPSGWNSVGWGQLLGLISEELGVRRLSSGLVVKERSFSDVVSPKVLSKAGASVIGRGKVCTVHVEEFGVKDRIQFLRNGLVFRLDREDGRLPDWKGFKNWMRKRLSGGFGGHVVRADRWMASSGTSNVVERRGWRWVVIKRIPAHLRSDAVLQDLARCLDEKAMGVMSGCSLNEVKGSDRGVMSEFLEDDEMGPKGRMVTGHEDTSDGDMRKGVVAGGKDVGSVTIEVDGEDLGEEGGRLGLEECGPGDVGLSESELQGPEDVGLSESKIQGLGDVGLSESALKFGQEGKEAGSDMGLDLGPSANLIQLVGSEAEGSPLAGAENCSLGETNGSQLMDAAPRFEVAFEGLLEEESLDFQVEEEALCEMSVSVARILGVSFKENTEIAEKEIVETA